MTELIENLLPIDEANAALKALRPEGNEIDYGQYYALADDQSLVHLPRLMAFQASINATGDSPWYRCKMALIPQNNINYMPWTPTIQKIKDAVEQRTGETWNLAHVIYYKDGDDSMGMHSDAMLDLVSGSKIAVVSFGCTRQMDLLKKTKSTVDGPSKIKLNLPNNSVFLLDEETNKHYVHGIRKQKNNETEDRISIVFRYVSTFKTDKEQFYGYELPFSTRQDVIQYESKRKMFHYLFSFLLTSFILWSFQIFTTNWLKLFISGFLWYFVIVITIQQVERVINNHRTMISNERLKELCKMKNFEIWDQRDMRAFLKSS